MGKESPGQALELHYVWLDGKPVNEGDELDLRMADGDGWLRGTFATNDDLQPELSIEISDGLKARVRLPRDSRLRWPLGE